MAKEFIKDNHYQFNPKYFGEENKDEYKPLVINFFDDEVENILKYDLVFERRDGYFSYFKVSNAETSRNKSFDRSLPLTVDKRLLGKEIDLLIDAPSSKKAESIFCSCDNQLKKHVVLSKTLQYDFCSNCKKEIN